MVADASAFIPWSSANRVASRRIVVARAISPRSAAAQARPRSISESIIRTVVGAAASRSSSASYAAAWSPASASAWTEPP